MSTLAIDPGLHGCGVAVMDDDGVLVDVDYVQSPHGTRNGLAWRDMSHAVAQRLQQYTADVVVIEKPQVYSGRRGNPDDLMQLVGVLGGIVALIPASKYITVTPRRWKGQLKKDVHHRRLAKILTEIERVHLDMCLSDVHIDLRHNAWDAVGLGLWQVKRRRPKR